MQEIAEKEDASNHSTSVEIIVGLRERKKKNRYGKESPERIIKGEGAESQPGMGVADSQTIHNPDSGLGFDRMKE